MLSFNSHLSWLSLLLLISVVPSLLLAQYTTATLSGIITDSSGRTVHEARVTIENTGTGLIRAYTTGEDGIYLFPALPVGTYRLHVEKEGFSPYSQEGITLYVNQTATQYVSVPLENLEVSEWMGIMLSLRILLRCSWFLRHSLALCLACSVLGRRLR